MIEMQNLTQNHFILIYMYDILVRHLCLFVCPNPLTDLQPQIWIGELGATTRMFLVWFKNSKISGLTSIGKASS